MPKYPFPLPVSSENMFSFRLWGLFIYMTCHVLCYINLAPPIAALQYGKTAGSGERGLTVLPSLSLSPPPLPHYPHVSSDLLPFLLYNDGKQLSVSLWIYDVTNCGRGKTSSSSFNHTIQRPLIWVAMETPWTVLCVCDAIGMLIFHSTLKPTVLSTDQASSGSV